MLILSCCTPGYAARARAPPPLVHLWVWGVRGLSNFDLLVGLLWLVSVWCGLVTGCGAWLGLVALLVAPPQRERKQQRTRL